MPEIMMLHGALDAARQQMLIVVPRWRGYKDLALPLKIRRILQDLTAAVRLIPNSGIRDAEDATEWGIRAGKETLEFLPTHLPFFDKTHYRQYIAAIALLVQDICKRESGHTHIIEILDEYGKSKHLSTVAQFAANELIEHYKHLSGIGAIIGERDVMTLLSRHSKVCEVYSKQMVLCTCLITLRDTGKHGALAELSKPRTEYEHNIEFVRGRIPLLAEPYDREVANSLRHVDSVVGVETRSVRFLGKEAGVERELSYECCQSAKWDTS